MNLDDLDLRIRGYCDAITADLAAFKAAQGPAVTRVRAGENLQAALDKGGRIELEAGATFEHQRFTLFPNTVLNGNGAKLHTTQGPSLYVPAGSSQIEAFDLFCTSDLKTESPVRLGAVDSTQMRLDDVPHHITLERVIVPSHRGKRGFSIHSSHTDLIDCEAHDVWTPGQDSQPWWIHNTPGKIRILGGAWSAGSELCLFGGAPFNIPGLVPTGVEVGGGLYYRPAIWQTDGQDYEVKNGLEVKNGADIWFHDLTVRGCWQFAQPVPAAFMLTPTNGGSVVGVRIDDVLLENCTDVLSVTGRDAAGLNLTQTTGIEVRRARGVLRKGSSRGVLVLAQRGVGSIAVDDCAIDTDGTKLAEFVDQTGAFSLTNSVCRLGKYGLTFGGFHASVTADPFVPNVTALNVSGNTFAGAGATTRFARRFPENKIPELIEFDALVSRLTAR